MTWLHITIFVSGIFSYHLGKIKPAAYTLIAIMIDAGL
jgi:hypothetical protein